MPDSNGADDECDAFELSRTYNVVPRHRCNIGDEYHLAFLRKLQKEAERRLVLRHREAIAALAEELLKKTEMNHEQVKKVIEPFTGPLNC